MRTHRCFRALRRAFAKGCDRFGFRLVHFSVQGNHIHLIVEAPDAESLWRAMKGLEVRMARALNKVMRRKGQVFPARYHAHLLESPREAQHAVRYVLENDAIHAVRAGRMPATETDVYSSEAWRTHWPPLTAPPRFWMLSVSVLQKAAA